MTVKCGIDNDSVVITNTTDYILFGNTSFCAADYTVHKYTI